MAKVTLICGISIALGVAAGVGLNLTRTAGTSPAVPRLEVQQPVSSVPQRLQLQTQNVMPAAGIDAAQMRSMMREELTGALARQQPTLGGKNQKGADEPVSPDVQRRSEQAVQEATALISTGGDWHNEDRESFHQKLAYMSSAQQEQMMQALVKAIDNGNITPATTGPAL